MIHAASSSVDSSGCPRDWCPLTKTVGRLLQDQTAKQSHYAVANRHSKQQKKSQTFSLKRRKEVFAKQRSLLSRLICVTFGEWWLSVPHLYIPHAAVSVLACLCSLMSLYITWPYPGLDWVFGCQVCIILLYTCFCVRIWMLPYNFVSYPGLMLFYTSAFYLFCLFCNFHPFYLLANQ